MSYKSPERRSSYQSQWVKSRRLKWLAENGPCRECGSNENLEVDHIDPSTKTSHRIWSLCEEKRLAELAKCQVLCRACHRKKSNAFVSALRSGSRGIPNKLTERQVLEIVARISSGIPVRSIAKEFEIHHATVTGINTGRIWAWLTKRGAA